MANAEILRPFVLSWEGGFVNDPADKGGATNKGVTLATFRNVFGQQRTIEDLKRISNTQWLEIFKKYYWDKWKADSIRSQAIANLLADWVWMSGTHGIKLPQKVLGVTQDGIVGNITIGAVNNYPRQKELFERLWEEREAFFRRIGTRTQAKYLKGWLNRLNSIQYYRLIMSNRKIITF